MVTQLPLLKLELQVTVLNGIPLVELPACLSKPEAMALKTTCQQLLQKEPARIVIDLSRTTFIDSSVIGEVVSSLKTTAEQRNEIILWSVHPQVREALILGGINRLVMIDAETEAITLADTDQLQNQIPSNYPSLRSRLKRLIDILVPV